MKRILLLQIFIFTSINCAFENSQSKLALQDTVKNVKYQIFSTDRILVKIICNSIEKSFNGKCIPVIDGNSILEERELVQQIFIETQLRESSSNFLSNSGKSLLTLTVGIFLINSAEVDFLFYLKNNNTVIENTSLSSHGMVGYWGVLPIYTGFIATSIGTLLNSYRRPDHLQKYCLYEDPSSVRKTFEATKEEYCNEYEIFLKDSFYKIEKDFFSIIEEAE